MQPLNGRRPSGPPRIRRDFIPRQHNENTEIISYVYDSWNKVQKDYLRNNSQYATGVPSVKYYIPSESNNRLDNFEPFDLESWWGKKSVQNYQNRSP